MKTHFLAGYLALSAATLAEPESATPRIVGPISDGTPTAPTEKAPLPNGVAEKIVVYPDAGRSITIEKISSPILAPVVNAPTPSTDPEPLDSADQLEAEREKEIFGLSATVYGHQKTLLCWWKGQQQYSAWSRLDFNHLSGFAEFSSNGKRWGFFMGLGNSEEMPADAPLIPEDGPGYVVIQGDAADAEAIAPVKALHEIYKLESARLIAAYIERQRNAAEHAAYLQAHPPQPQNTTVRFWKRESPQQGGEE